MARMDRLRFINTSQASENVLNAAKSILSILGLFVLDIAHFANI